MGQRPSKLPHISELDLMWLAGLLEGEGCFDMNSKGSPRVRLRMTDVDVVDRVAVIVGLPPDRVKMYAPFGLGKMHSYDISINGTAAIELMQLLRLQMGGRRRNKIADILRAYAGLHND